MSRNKEYSVKKVTVAVTSILIGISAGSLGTAYAQIVILNLLWK